MLRTSGANGVIVREIKHENIHTRAAKAVFLNANTVKVVGQATGPAVRELTVGRTGDAVRPSNTERTA